MINNKTKVITGMDLRLSYFNGWEPKSINGGPVKYSVSVLILKDDVKTIKAIEEAIDAAIEEGVGKFGGKKPNKAAIKLHLRDGEPLGRKVNPADEFTSLEDDDVLA